MNGDIDHQYRRQATQGLLHMIDTNPTLASDAWQQLAMIQDHLREHAYYKRPLRRKGAIALRTEHDCKQLLSELASQSKLGRLKEDNENIVDVIFRVGSSKISENILAKYDYDQATFDPTSLPGPPSNTKHLGNPKPPKGSHSMRSCSEPPPSDDDDDASDDVGDEDFAVPDTSPNENHALLSLPAAAAQQHALWTLLQDINATSHLADHDEWKYRNNINRNASLELLIRRFSLVHRKNGLIHPYTAVALNNGLRTQFSVQPNPEMLQTPFSQLYRLGSKAFAPSYVYQLKKGYEMVINATGRPRYSSLPKAMTSVEVFAELNGDKEGSIGLHEDDQDGKKSRSDGEIDNTSRSSSLTEASWHDAESTGKSSQSSGLDVNLRNSTTTRKSNTIKALRRPTPSPLTTPAAFSPKPTVSNLARWESAWTDLSKNITKAVSSLFTHLSLPFSQVSPYLPSSSLSLRPVFETCFGDDFQSACASFRDSDNFSAFNVTQCLVAALIYEHLLKERLDWQRALCIQLGWSQIEDVQNLFTMLRDPLQNAVAREKHLPRRFAEAILKSADDDHDGEVLPRFMQQFANQLTSDLSPYIEILLQIATLLNQEKIHTDETWHKDFEENIAAIVASAADLKLKLTTSELEHYFFRPTAGEHFDGDMHKAISATGNSVGFAVMPGLRLIEGESTAVLPAHVVCYSGEKAEET